MLLAGWAMAQPPAGPAQRAERPEPAVMQVAPVDPKLDTLLQIWERKTAEIKILHGEHMRREFNDVFQVEKQSRGEFWFASPDKGRIDMKGVAPDKGAVSRKKDPKTGEPYRLDAGMNQIWICNGQQITVIDPPQQQFERMEIPEELRGSNIIRSPLPFLFGMKAEDAKKRFHMTLVRESDRAVQLDIIPRTKADAQNYSRATVYLNKETYLPYHVHLIDPSGSASTIYEFDREKLEINQQGILEVMKLKNPFNPRLLGYKEIQAPNGGVQPAGNQQPAGQQKLATPKSAATNPAPASKTTKSAFLPR